MVSTIRSFMSMASKRFVQFNSSIILAYWAMCRISLQASEVVYRHSLHAVIRPVSINSCAETSTHFRYLAGAIFASQSAHPTFSEQRRKACDLPHEPSLSNGSRRFERLTIPTFLVAFADAEEVVYFRLGEPEPVKVEDSARRRHRRSLPPKLPLMVSRADPAKKPRSGFEGTPTLAARAKDLRQANKGIKNDTDFFAIEDGTENCFAGHRYAHVQGGPQHYWTLEQDLSLSPG
ncbi:hypothetical protein CHS0354_035462 [Potamilus streckersoni]|uniref:Uncharacterized protein n=1 Tax=Potamilus streckersoni TaxID=2493646 RepID=A0AAE0WAU0_9BIVA|nr:hypothetical protein CHS0354_035462 [Potamilus streckersoni]